MFVTVLQVQLFIEFYLGIFEEASVMGRQQYQLEETLLVGQTPVWLPHQSVQ